MAAILVGYARVSTCDQQAGLDAQVRDLTAADCEEIFSEQVPFVVCRISATVVRSVLSFLYLNRWTLLMRKNWRCSANWRRMCHTASGRFAYGKSMTMRGTLSVFSKASRQREALLRLWLRHAKRTPLAIKGELRNSWWRLEKSWDYSSGASVAKVIEA